jgi:hypothetical protein
MVLKYNASSITRIDMMAYTIIKIADNSELCLYLDIFLTPSRRFRQKRRKDNPMMPNPA